MIAADIKEFISDKVCHPISYFQITFISAPVKVLKPNVIEFYLFLTIIQWTRCLLNFESFPCLTVITCMTSSSQ